jgi:ferredoxin--NADP+ reductase
MTMPVSMNPTFVENTDAAVPTFRIAIVGAGPSGCYTAQSLRKLLPDAAIDIYDRDAEPFGLLRFGVAPDHLGTKALTKQLTRVFGRDGVRFVGGTEIGTTVSLDELKANHDAVVLATGLWADRKLADFHPAPGEPTPAGLYGAGEITRMLNGHPTSVPEQIDVGRRMVIVGQGNVAMDLVRLSLTAHGDLLGHGVPDRAAAALNAGTVSDIDVVGRSDVAHAKFDVAMLKELGRFTDVRFTCDLPDDADHTDPRVAALRDLEAASPADAARRMTFRFGWTPRSLDSDAAHVTAANFRDTAGARPDLRLDTDSVITAVGFTEGVTDPIRCSTLVGADSDLDAGVLGDSLYCVGWCRRGPTGTVPTNRTDAKLVAKRIAHDLAERAARTPSTPTPVSTTQAI